jgi:hypothetical protein
MVSFSVRQRIGRAAELAVSFFLEATSETRAQPGNVPKLRPTDTGKALGQRRSCLAATLWVQSRGAGLWTLAKGATPLPSDNVQRDRRISAANSGSAPRRESVVLGRVRQNRCIALLQGANELTVLVEWAQLLAARSGKSRAESRTKREAERARVATLVLANTILKPKIKTPWIPCR